MIINNNLYDKTSKYFKIYCFIFNQQPHIEINQTEKSGKKGLILTEKSTSLDLKKNWWWWVELVKGKPIAIIHR